MKRVGSVAGHEILPPRARRCSPAVAGMDRVDMVAKLETENQADAWEVNDVR